MARGGEGARGNDKSRARGSRRGEGGSMVKGPADDAAGIRGSTGSWMDERKLSESSFSALWIDLHIASRTPRTAKHWAAGAFDDNVEPLSLSVEFEFSEIWRGKKGDNKDKGIDYTDG